jgi:aminomethyltransferase
MSGTTLRKTPLNAIHRSLGGRMVDFAGWDMPVQFSGVIEEHLAVRTAAGLFDVSHMGEIFLTGKDALPNLQRLTTNDVSRLADGQVHYSALTYPDATFVDDILVHRFSETSFFLCVNASNADKDYDWIRQHCQGDVRIENRSPEYAQIAIQGPRSAAILQPHTDAQLHQLKYYWFTTGKCCGKEAIIARTGYTGEDGFEVFIAPEHAVKVWEAIMNTGSPEGLIPAGLAARNTLRLEAKMALYGNDIDHTTTVLEADLGWIVKLNKGDFHGRDVLLEQKERGVGKLLVGFEMVDKGIARDHYPMRLNGQEAGHITSGSYAPYLKKNIGLAYLPATQARPGIEFEVMVRDKALRAVIVPTPFYKRQK